MVILRPWEYWGIEMENLMDYVPQACCGRDAPVARHTANRDKQRARSRIGCPVGLPALRAREGAWRHSVRQTRKPQSARLAGPHAHGLFLLVDAILFALVHFFHGLALGVAR